MTAWSMSRTMAACARLPSPPRSPRGPPAGFENAGGVVLETDAQIEWADRHPHRLDQEDHLLVAAMAVDREFEVVVLVQIIVNVAATGGLGELGAVAADGAQILAVDDFGRVRWGRLREPC